MKSVFLSALLAAAAVSSANAASFDERRLSPDAMTVNAASPALSWRGIAANGRCGGISYGTGARRCSDATGGPIDGPGMRN